MQWTQYIDGVLPYLDTSRYLTADWLKAIPLTIALALIFLVWNVWYSRWRLKRFVSARLIAPVRERWALAFRQVRLCLRVMAIAVLCVALARPFGATQPEVANRQGSNIVIALDGSRSMWAQDVSPSRFEHARQGLLSLLDSFQGDRASLMFFASQPTFVAPLTFDTVSLKVIAQGLDPELAGKGGSNLAAVIERATEYLSRKPYPSKALILFTDGEETEGDAVIAAQEAYQKYGVRIFTIGVGTEQGATIPRLERDLQRRLVHMGTVKDLDGNTVISKLESHTLTSAAVVGGGSYVDLQPVSGNLKSFYTDAILPLAAPMDEVPLENVREWFQIPLAIALCFLLLELLWPTARRRRRNAPAAIRWRPAAALFGLVLLTVLVPAVAEHEAQPLITAGKSADAFRLLQTALLKEPENPLANYNYAVGAYAAGKYAVAIDTFSKLAAETREPEIELKSHAQLGNSLYRLGEELRKNSPEATVLQWTQALEAYDKAGERPMAQHNQAKVRKDLLALLNRLARNKETEGDEAARTTPENGIPAWREALTFHDQALKIARDEAQVKTATRARASVANKIIRTYLDSAEDKRRRAEFQKDAALELAIEQMEQAISDYTEALAVSPEHTDAQAAVKSATKTLEPWLVEYAGQLHEDGQFQKAGFLEEALQLWNKAGALYARVLEQNPQNAAAQRGQDRNTQALHDGNIELGDRKQKIAAQNINALKERDALLEQALEHYQTALTLKPDSAKARERWQQLGLKLTGRFTERGLTELAEGQKLAKPKPPEAIGWLERSIQSFSKALAFQQDNPKAQTGKKTAEELLRQLRELDAEHQRKMLAQNKQLQNAEEMKDPGKLALKLLDYDTDQLASKRQQNYTLAEQKSGKEW